MTDEVVKMGIEDVLSSIKRLVSEEDRRIPSVLEASNSRKRSRLVLTDALRVGDVAEKEKSQPQVAEPDYRAEDSVKPMLLRACDVVNHTEPAIEQRTGTEQEDVPADSLSSKIEALEAAIARTEDQWEPDGDSEDAYSGTPTKPLEWVAELETSTRPQEWATDSEMPTRPPEWAAEDEFNISYSAKISPAEMMHADVDTTSKATFVRDPAVVASRQAAKPEVKSPVAPTAKKDALNIDEDALRGLIAQVVREELQGVLGQRITRNVRKMVRREIHRALADRELK
ncbi:hypothetical protein RUE5091_02866 [Ruegeria denitrificans]|uniref:Uncharacterized protein n=1 Tax=Ruegeria denitrificans TaxID=1715692 RepID=A0A0P1IUC3_9RHOB|nr:hypothetical protein [Ruegeria denitrificans]CUK06652.1 hypothetical protein RUE5091_02866 [Ruegeria denitrificans]